MTVVITTIFVLLCLAARRHYDSIKSGLRSLGEVLGAIPTTGATNTAALGGTHRRR